MTTRTAGPRTSALILALGAIVVASSVAAAVVLGGDGSAADPGPTGAPSPIASPAVTPPPAVTPAPTATPDPSEDPGDAMPITVDLETLTPHHVYIDVVDRSGTLVSAVSGTPTASAAVEPYTLLVENLDARTLRLTWVDRPGDNALALFIDDGAARFVLVQPEHDLDGDSIVHDRVLILTFRDAISASDVETFLQDGLDTPG